MELRGLKTKAFGAMVAPGANFFQKILSPILTESGGSGSGKTRFYVKPQLMQMPRNVSFVVTDPKGTILVECGKMLQRGTPKMQDGKPVRDKNGKIIYEPYRIKTLNTINFSKSMHYNPFRYIRSEKDILKLVNTLIANTKGEGEKSAEDLFCSRRAS